MDTKESPVGVIASWAALCASFVLSFATWVALAEMAGFTGQWRGIQLSWFMAVAVDGYIVSALVAWMAPVSDEIARFAKANTYAGAAVSVVAQSAYHGLSADTTRGQWVPYLAAVVGALPPLAAGLSVHLRALVRRAHLSGQDKRDTVADMIPAVQPEPLSVPDMAPALEPVRTPRPRTPRTDPAWKVRARDLIAAGLSDREIAEKILADEPATWNTPEAGRKAVSRLR